MSNTPLLDLPDRVDDLPDNKLTPVLAICQRGNLSLSAALYLMSLGYVNARSVTGGTNAWIDAGREVEPPESRRELRRSQIPMPTWPPSRTPGRARAGCRHASPGCGSPGCRRYRLVLESSIMNPWFEPEYIEFTWSSTDHTRQPFPELVVATGPLVSGRFRQVTLDSDQDPEIRRASSVRPLFDDPA